METPKKQEDKKIDIPVGIIELPKIDISKYIGKKAKIINADIFEGQFGAYVKIQTEIIETLENNGNKIDILGSKILGLHQDKQGNYGWSADTKLGKFLDKMKSKDLNSLIGKTVILQSQTSATGTDFLSFN